MKNGKPKDIDYNAGGQGQKGKKNLRRRNTEHKEKKINNSRELLNQEGEKTIYIQLGLRSVLRLKDLNAAYWFSTFSQPTKHSNNQESRTTKEQNKNQNILYIRSSSAI